MRGVPSSPVRRLLEVYTSHPWYQCVKDPFEYLKGYGIMKYMRIVPPEEVKAREETEKKKRGEKLAKRMAQKKKKG